MKPTGTRASYLYSPHFMAGLVVMLLNDVWLKPFYHNWVTGKLSDIAGMYVFPVFLCYLFPRYRKHCYWFTAIAFAWWKTELSQPFADWLLAHAIPLGRTVDWTDLMAIAVIPVSYRLCMPTNGRWLAGLRPQVLAIMALVVFCNDSPPMHTRLMFKGAYNSNLHRDTKETEAQLVSRLRQSGLMVRKDSVSRYGQTSSDSKWVSYIHYYSIEHYVAGADTFSNVSFSFNAYSAAPHLTVWRYDVKGYNGRERRRQRRENNNRFDAELATLLVRQ